MMSAASLSLSLRSAIMSTGLLQPVSHSENPKHFWVLSRIIPGQEKPWLEVVAAILVDFEMSAWDGEKPDLVIARRYVAKEGRVVFGWYINIVAKTVKDLELVVNHVGMHLEGARPVLNRLEDQDEEPRRGARVVREAVEEEEAPAASAPARTRVLAPGQHPPPRKPVPRPPGPALSNPVPPNGFRHQITIVKKQIGKNGRPAETIEEMPLPHVYAPDMNKLNAKGKGAAFIGGDNGGES